jgi:hypothetical protein
MLIQRIGAEASQEAKDQARLEAEKEIGSQEKFEAELKEKVRNQTSQRAKDYSGIETDQGFTSHSYNKNGTYAEVQPKTKRYSFNEKGEIVDVKGIRNSGTYCNGHIVGPVRKSRKSNR